MCIYVGADQRMGMSGSPVFNGCGLAGISVARSFQVLPFSFENVTMNATTAYDAEVVHVDEIVALLNRPEAQLFAVPRSLSVVDMPTMY
jgi:hypothetical protein